MLAGRTIRVVVVEPHPSVRHGLRANLEAEPGFDVVGETAGGEQALGEIERLLPDVVLLDLGLVEREGGSAMIDAVLERSPGSRILVLSALEDERSIRAALAAARAVCGGEVARATGGPALSGREVEILRLVARGLSNREIAVTLVISEGTVKTHLRRIFVKLGVGDRTQAAIAALKQGAIRL